MLLNMTNGSQKKGKTVTFERGEGKGDFIATILPKVKATELRRIAKQRCTSLSEVTRNILIDYLERGALE